jgi:catechol 2,3-dioxygenase-like lactoylglutathione lyase family enzyme
MPGALDRLREVPGWRAISSNGPEHLPHRSGGATAFKFRDPEGHPLELISFPQISERAVGSPGRSVEINHSAISATDLDRSIAFYSGLGFTTGARSLNTGMEQRRLDGVADARVDVVELDLPDTGPHLELLHYRGQYDRNVMPPGTSDIAATRTVLLAQNAAALGEIRDAYSSIVLDSTDAAVLLRDPDGHLVEVRRDI